MPLSQGLSTEFHRLSERMRSQWDQRIAHDYRFWMSDGVESDVAMWATGERDFCILIKGVDRERAKSQVALELACGVGRLLPSAAYFFGHVIGIDVSEQAIAQAKKFLVDKKNVELLLGNGFDLQDIAANSVDFAYTFAGLSSMPVLAIASYLIEFSRVVKIGGLVRLQVYLGRPQNTVEDDTIAIRCFDRGRFIAAVQEAGFELDFVEELHLPFEVSDKETGLIAEIVGLQKKSNARLSPKQISEILLDSPEKKATEAWSGSETQYCLAVVRARQHLEAGNVLEAKNALEFAVAHYARPEPEVCRLLAALSLEITTNGDRSKLRSRQDSTAHADGQDRGSQRQETHIVGIQQISTRSPKPSPPETLRPEKLGAHFQAELYERNLKILSSRFPEVWEQLSRVNVGDTIAISRASNGMRTIIAQGLPLDHREKPVEAGLSWASRALHTPRMKDAQAVVVIGFAGGYHLQGLRKLCDKVQHVVEPNLEILKASLGVRDCSEELQSIATLLTSAKDFQRLLEKEIDLHSTELVVHPQTQILSREAVDEIRRGFWSGRGIEQLRPAIAVVGPLYGGSLPITDYTERALARLNQRVKSYHLSDFFQGYSHIEQVLKNKTRIGTLHAYYVEMLSQLVLEAITERPVNIVICMAQAPMSARVLTELRNRGIITVMWFVEDCNRFKTWESLARYYDYMFLIQRERFPALVEKAGAGRAIYLPVGCDPEIHSSVSVTEEEKRRFGSNVSFVGAGYNNRQQMFASLAQKNFKIWGTDWPQCSPFDKLVQEKGRRISPEDYVKIFNASSVNLNLHSSMERDGVEPYGDFVNPRTFELASCGAFQLVDNRSLLPEMFEVGKEMVTFGDRAEMHEKIEYYLDHPNERYEIAAQSRSRALRDHTYVQRLRTMLGYIYADRFDELQAKEKEGPWLRTLSRATSHPELKSRLQTVYERGEEPRLDGLVADIQVGKGTLTETEQKLLFLHHIRSQITYINDLRDGKTK